MSSRLRPNRAIEIIHTVCGIISSSRRYRSVCDRRRSWYSYLGCRKITYYKILDDLFSPQKVPGKNTIAYNLKQSTNISKKYKRVVIYFYFFACVFD